jgi:hypothetical protein
VLVKALGLDSEGTVTSGSGIHCTARERRPEASTASSPGTGPAVESVGLGSR